MAAKYPTTVKDVESPWTRRTAERLLIGAEEITVYLRPSEKGESGKWVASAAGVEGSGATIEKAIDAAIETRTGSVSALPEGDVTLPAEPVVETLPEDTAQTPAPAEVPAPVKAKKGKKGKKEKTVQTDAPDNDVPEATVVSDSGHVSLKGVVSDPAPVQDGSKSKDKGKNKSVAEAVKSGTAVKAPAPAEPLKISGSVVASLIHSSWMTSAGAVTRFLGRQITASDAFLIIGKAQAQITQDAARAVADGVDAERVGSLVKYAQALTLHHVALIGRGGERLTPAANKRARQKLNKWHKAMTAA